MKCNIPGTAREIVENLININKYSVKQIASLLGVSSKTIYRIKKGFVGDPRIHINLIQLYLSLQEKSFDGPSSAIISDPGKLQ